VTEFNDIFVNEKGAKSRKDLRTCFHR